MTVLDVRDLVVEYRTDGVTRAVDGLSFVVPAGGTVAVVGESGSGKSTISQAVMGLLPPAARIAGGQMLFTDPADGSVTDLAAFLLPKELGRAEGSLVEVDGDGRTVDGEVGRERAENGSDSGIGQLQATRIRRDARGRPRPRSIR